MYLSANKRKKIAEKEGTRDPIFLLEVARFYVPQASFEHDLYVECDFFDEGGVFLTPESLAEYEELDMEDEEAVDAFWHECDTLTDDELFNHKLAYRHWETSSVWLTRDEARDYAKKRKHHYGEEGKHWRVYCMSAEGELASALIGYAARGTNYLSSSTAPLKWRIRTGIRNLKYRLTKRRILKWNQRKI